MTRVDMEAVERMLNEAMPSGHELRAVGTAASRSGPDDFGEYDAHEESEADGSEEG